MTLKRCLDLVRFAVVCLGFFFAVSTVSQAAERKPNFLFVYTDDQRWDAMGVVQREQGDRARFPWFQTPNMDRVASEGVRFRNAFVTLSLCAPSRAAFLTGRYNHSNGVINNHTPFPETSVTHATLLGAAGYKTAYIGKWHLGSGAGHKPLDHGFDYSFGFMGGCIDNYTHFFYWGEANRHDLWENNKRVRFPGRYFPDLMVEKTRAFIADHRSKPFFIYFAINMPHYPYQGDPKWVEHYRNLPYPRKLYAAFVSTLDERVQQVLACLEENGLRDNTIVIYQSDNGHSVEERAHLGGGSSGPYRGAKFSVFEGGIRLPAIISWPGHLPEGEVRGQIAHGCDWLPTLAELCGVKTPAVELNGRSLVPVIKSATAASPHDVLQWRLGNQWAVRDGPWKLLHNRNDQADAHKLSASDKEWFLANIDADPGEQTNQASAHPELVERLRKLAPAGTNR
jgi:arylsulfatase A-like enzyme